MATHRQTRFHVQWFDARYVDGPRMLHIMQKHVIVALFVARQNVPFEGMQAFVDLIALSRNNRQLDRIYGG